MMYEAIKNFPKQFAYEPAVENADRLKKHNKFIVLGMGGSNLAPDLLKIRDPYLDIVSYRGYGLPKIAPSVLKKSLIIASSYSGNTEEVVDGFKEALKRKLPIAVLTTGGELLELAKNNDIPYVQMPSTGIQPRSALGYAMLGLAAIMGLPHIKKELHELTTLLNSGEFEDLGKELAKRLNGRVPIIYASLENTAVAYNWKIKFNETGKIPAFMNIFSELNHNEMTGFDVVPSTQNLSKYFHFIFLEDASDHPKVIQRMKVTKNLYEKRGLSVETIPLVDKTIFQKTFSSLLLADWTAYYSAQEYGVEAEQVPMVEELKKLIK